VILIPYRNRKEHLDYFLQNSWPLLKQNLPNSKLSIIEQEEGKLFNRGKILNVGFKEYMDKTNYFITHDVDVNPYEKTIHLYKIVPNNNEVVGIFSSPCMTLGGIIKISNEIIKKINGFPNNYWGWGVEDRALYNRAKHFGMNIHYNIFSNSKEATSMFNRFNNIDDRKRDNNFSQRTHFEYSMFHEINREEQYNHIMRSGLNNLEYTILERINLQDDVEIIKVSI